jgi:serine/threonine-protein kinase
VRLKSEHVARILDVGTLPGTDDAPGAPYIVMEYLEGHDLGSYAHGLGGKLPVAEACDYLLQACEAIAEAHAIGIIHRDLKPSNLFVTKALDGSPFVKVLDFGISKIVTADTAAMSLTKTTEVIGSPNYMSPEQLRSAKDVDARSDIWSLGVILYELLTGTVPFPADTITHLTAMVLQDPPVPLRSIRADVPTSLEMLVNHCLEKDRRRRFQSVGELARVLEGFAGGRSRGVAARISQVEATRSQSTPPGVASLDSRSRVSVNGGGTSVSWGDTEAVPKKRGRRTPWVVGGIALVVVSAVGAALALRTTPADGGGTTTTGSASGAATATASGAATATASAPASATAAASASAIPSASAAPPASPRVFPPVPKPRPSASAAKPGDDLPSERH